METSIFIARIASIVFLSMGIGFFYNKDFYRKMLDGYVKNVSILYTEGILEIVLGYFIVYYHNIWVMDWTALITVLGWGILIEGIFMLAFPEIMINACKYMLKMKKNEIFTLIIIALGLIYGYFGFIV